MKTGVVLEITGRRAMVLDGSGSFRTVAAEEGWRTGDVVYLPSLRSKRMWALPLAACLVAALLGTGGFLWFDETALVSLDVNPSVELGLNRFERVVSVTTRNDGGEGLLSSVEVRGQSVDTAVRRFLESDYLLPYLEASDYVSLSVQSENGALAPRLESAARGAGQVGRVECHQVDADTVTRAHQYGVSASKYLALLELQSADPALDINTYTHCTIGEIKSEAQRCRDNGHGDLPDDAAPEEESHRGGNGYGYGGGRGNGGGHDSAPGHHGGGGRWR